MTARECAALLALLYGTALAVFAWMGGFGPAGVACALLLGVGAGWWAGRWLD